MSRNIDYLTSNSPSFVYVQILHQLAATGWDFAILKAYIRYHVDGEVRISIRHYRIERSEEQNNIDYLIAAETKFWKQVQNDEKPDLILPEI